MYNLTTSFILQNPIKTHVGSEASWLRWVRNHTKIWHKGIMVAFTNSGQSFITSVCEDQT